MSLELCWPSFAPGGRQSTPNFAKRQLVFIQIMMVALYALRVHSPAGSRCMIALCDLLVKHQAPDGAVQACTSQTVVALDFIPTLVPERGTCRDPACMTRRNKGRDNTHQLQLCSDCTSSCSWLSALCLGCCGIEDISSVPITVPCLATATRRRDLHRPWLLKIRAIYSSGR